MPTVRIPRSRISRNDMDWARLVLRVYPRRLYNPIEGKPFKPGKLIDERELWPTDEYPATPLLMEYAGSDHTSRKRNESNHIYLLWRYNVARHDWEQILRCLTKGGGCIYQMMPAILQELGPAAPPVDSAYAATVSGKILHVLDDELGRLAEEERNLVMRFVYQEFTARAVNYA